jgi:hypothetical protein
MEERNMKKIVYVFAAALMTLASCDKWLNTSPQSELTEDIAFRTRTDLQLFTNPLYNNLLDKEVYGEQSDLQLVEKPSALMQGGSYRTTPATGGGWSWGNLRRINTCLDNMDKCSDAAAVEEYTALCKFWRAFFYFDKIKRFGDVPWVEHELGSADETLYNPRDTREVVMGHMIEDIDYAIEHLPASYSSGSYYRVTKWAAMALKSRFCLFEGTFRKYHGLTFEGHDEAFYLKEAAAAALRLMTESPFSLYNTGKPNEDYVNLFAAYDANRKEYIMAIKFDAGMQIFHNGTAYATMTSQGRPGMTKKMVDTYLMKDGTRFTDKPGWEIMEFKDEVADRDPRLGQTVRLPGYKRVNGKNVVGVDFYGGVTGFQYHKFVMPEDNASSDRLDKSYNDLPVYRMGEVYLNYAEALAELGTLTQADLDKSVNLLRKRVGMPDLKLADANSKPDWYLASAEYGYPNVSGPNKGIILEIRRERMVELAQESFRWADLDRWKAGKCIEQVFHGPYFPGTGEYDLDGDGKLDLCIYTGNKPSSKATYIMQLDKEIFLSEGTKGYYEPYHSWAHQFDEARDYYFPIPLNDITLNNNLTQNPGWDDIDRSGSSSN